MIGLSAAIAIHLTQLQYPQLPATTVLASKRAILDGRGVMLAASSANDAGSASM